LAPTWEQSEKAAIQVARQSLESSPILKCMPQLHQSRPHPWQKDVAFLFELQPQLGEGAHREGLRMTASWDTWNAYRFRTLCPLPAMELRDLSVVPSNRSSAA
jgi:hypothetical protein